MANDLLELLESQEQASKLSSYDEVVCSDMNKLKRLLEMFLEYTGNYVTEIYVRPLDILQMRLEDIKDLSFLILCNSQVEIDNLKEYQKSLRELLKAYLEDEFSTDVNVDNIIFAYDWNNMKEQYLCLFSRFPIRDYGMLSDYEKSVIKELVLMTERPISICYSSLLGNPKSVCIHANSNRDFTNIESHIKAVASGYNVKLSNSKKGNNIRYTILVSSLIDNLDLPYTKVTIEDVNSTYISEENETLV